MKNCIVYTLNGSLVMPDKQVFASSPKHSYVPLRGYGFIMAVIEDNKCIGFIDSTYLGYETVKDWLKAQGSIGITSASQ